MQWQEWFYPLMLNYCSVFNMTTCAEQDNKNGKRTWLFRLQYVVWQKNNSKLNKTEIYDFSTFHDFLFFFTISRSQQIVLEFNSAHLYVAVTVTQFLALSAAHCSLVPFFFKPHVHAVCLRCFWDTEPKPTFSTLSNFEAVLCTGLYFYGTA